MKLIICKKIKELRLSNRYSQADVADKLHMSQNAYSELETGKVKKIDVERLSQIAALYKVPVSQLIELPPPIRVKKEPRLMG